MKAAAAKYYNKSIENGYDFYPIPLGSNEKYPLIQHKELKMVTCEKKLQVRKNTYEKYGVDPHIDYYDAFPEILENPLWEDNNMGLLCKGIAAIDYDGKHEIPNLTVETSNCPVQQTAKGYHFIFKRPENWPIFDKARCLKHKGEVLDIDIKTLCSSGTAGVLKVHPSPGRKWIRSPFKYDIPEMPEDIRTFIEETYMSVQSTIQYERSIGKSATSRVKDRSEFNIKPTPLDSYLSNVIKLVNPEDYNNWLMMAVLCKMNDWGYEKWCEWARQSEKFSETDSIRLWDNIEYGHVTVGTLKFMAMRDNETDYRKLFIDRKIEKTLKCNATRDKPYYDLFRSLSGDTLKFIEDEDKKISKFMAYENCRWQFRSKKTIQRKIKNTLYDVISDRLNMMYEMNEQNPSDKLQTYIGLAEKFKSSLECYGRLRSITDYAQMEAVDENFLETLDQNPYLMGFNNGILDLSKTNCGEFYDTNDKPELLVSLTTERNYEVPTTEQKVWWDTEIRKIIPNDEIRIFLQAQLGVALLGDSRDKKIMIFTDVKDGNNGKSTLIKNLHLCLGKYISSEASKFLGTSSNENQNSHTANLADCENLRFLTIDELQKGMTLNIAFLKEISGKNARIKARGCSATGFAKFSWKALPIIGFNDAKLPKMNLDEASGPFVDRLCVIEFGSKFVHHGEDPENHIYKKDDNFDEVCGNNRCAIFAWLLDGLKYYWSDYEAATRVPDSVAKFRNDLMNNNNDVHKFCEEYIRKKEKDDVITSNNIVNKSNMYRKFCSMSAEYNTKIDRDTFFKLLKSTLGMEDYSEKHCGSRCTWKCHIFEDHDIQCTEDLF